MNLKKNAYSCTEKEDGRIRLKELKKGVKVFEPLYKINYSNFEVEIDNDGEPLLDEDLSFTIEEFRNWCYGQEDERINLFVKEK